MTFAMILAALAALGTAFLWRYGYFEKTEDSDIEYLPKPPATVTTLSEPQKPVSTATTSPTLPTMTNQEKLYQTAAQCLGTHQTLDPAVPDEVGCGEAWCSVAKLAGVQNIPKTGIAGTANLYLWLKANSAFKEVDIPEAGDTIISPTGYGNGSVTGHVGIVAKHGILSNNSDNGLFQEKWTLPKWKDYYHTYGGLPMTFFRWLGENPSGN